MVDTVSPSEVLTPPSQRRDLQKVLSQKGKEYPPELQWPTLPWPHFHVTATIWKWVQKLLNPDLQVQKHLLSNHQAFEQHYTTFPQPYGQIYFAVVALHFSLHYYNLATLLLLLTLYNRVLYVGFLCYHINGPVKLQQVRIWLFLFCTLGSWKHPLFFLHQSSTLYPKKKWSLVRHGFLSESYTVSPWTETYINL